MKSINIYVNGPRVRSGQHIRLLSFRKKKSLFKLNFHIYFSLLEHALHWMLIVHGERKNAIITKNLFNKYMCIQVYKPWSFTHDEKNLFKNLTRSTQQNQTRTEFLFFFSGVFLGVSFFTRRIFRPVSYA